MRSAARRAERPRDGAGPEDVPDDVPKGVPGDVPDGVPDDVPERAFPTMFLAMFPNAVPDDVPGGVPERCSRRRCRTMFPNAVPDAAAEVPRDHPPLAPKPKPIVGDMDASLADTRPGTPTAQPGAGVPGNGAWLSEDEYTSGLLVQVSTSNERGLRNHSSDLSEESSRVYWAATTTTDKMLTLESPSGRGALCSAHFA